MADDKVPISIAQTDLVGDCKRLNRRFDLVEGRVSSTESDLTTLQGNVETLTTKVDGLPAQGATTGAMSPAPLAAPATALDTAIVADTVIGTANALQMTAAGVINADNLTDGDALLLEISCSATTGLTLNPAASGNSRVTLM